MEKNTRIRGMGQVEVREYKNGVIIANTRPIERKQEGPIGGIRGTIGGWSAASRRKFRKWLITHFVDDSRSMVAVTLTIPGPILPPAKVKNLFEIWRKRLDRREWGMIWRMEIQKRGQIHWHGMMSVPMGTEREEIVRCWLACLHNYTVPMRVGDANWDTKHVTKHGKRSVMGDMTEEQVIAWWSTEEAYDFTGGHVDEAYAESVVHRDEWKGAARRSCVVDVIPSDASVGKWTRYILDHTSKRKQEQIAYDMGRHWGVVNKSTFAEVEPETIICAPRSVSVKALRWINRLRTPQIKRKKPCPFGRSLGHPAGRVSLRGSRVLFGKTETYRAIMEHAYRECGVELRQGKVHSDPDLETTPISARHWTDSIKGELGERARAVFGGPQLELVHGGHARKATGT